MKKLKENNLIDDFAEKTTNYAFEYGITSKTSPSSGEDGYSEINKFVSSLPESEQIIRRPKKSDNIKNLLNKTKMKSKLPIGKMYSIGKTESKEATGASGAGAYVQPLFAETKKEFKEKWSQKYKKSIDCNNPKGFSQRAHCQGKKKKQVSEEKLKGGKADNKTLEDIVSKHIKHAKFLSIILSELKKQLSKGIKVELEHTNDKSKAKEIALDHLYEDPNYYEKLEKVETKESLGGKIGKVAFKDSKFVRNSLKETPKKIETKEATGASSSGSYVTPAAWAKSTSKKDWRGRSKTQIPGGKFVQVKKKCKKFPYCNQGDINALKIFDSVEMKKTIKEISDSYGVSENAIKNIIAYEYGQHKSNK